MTTTAQPRPAHHVPPATLADLLREIQSRDPALARKVIVLEDCTAKGGVPHGPDFTDAATEARRGCAAAGMRVVRSTAPLEDRQ